MRCLELGVTVIIIGTCCEKDPGQRKELLTARHLAIGVVFGHARLISAAAKSKAGRQIP